MREANWGVYSMKPSGKLMEMISDLTDDVDELNSIITYYITYYILCETVEEVIGNSSGMRKKKMVPW